MQKKLSKITIQDLDRIYDLVGERSGWDFSQMKKIAEPPPWNYMNMVVPYLEHTDHVLDIGTGGGEKLITLSQYFSTGVGIDNDPEMIKVANKNAIKDNNTKLTFKCMNADKLFFNDNTFDMVLNRHSVVDPAEVSRVLKPNGYFITEQVTNENMMNLKQILGDTRRWPNELSRIIDDFKTHNCLIVGWGRYDIEYLVKDLESLIFWLKAVNVPENFTIKKHGKKLLDYIDKYQSKSGFITNESREFLVIKKNV